jgi:capsular polysaccharide transport system permease protein
MADFTPIRPTYYASVWKEMKQIYYLLIIREIKTRFGRLRLGWVWFFLEPILHLFIFVSILSLRSRSPILEDTPNAVYVLNGLIPWFLFRNIVSRCTTGIAANKGLFIFSKIRPLDTVSVRFIMEWLINGIIYLAAVLCLWWIFDITMLPERLMEWLMSLLLFSLLGLGLGSIITVIALYFPEIHKISDVMLMGFYFTSGIFFVPAHLPALIQSVLRWNPIFLGIDLCKANALEGYLSFPTGKMFFVLFALGTFILGHHTLKRHIAQILSE